MRRQASAVQILLCLSVLAVFLFVGSRSAIAEELTVDGFKFDGPMGSHGATIERIAENHFKITLGAAPHQPTWCNMLYFQITDGAQGNELRVDVEFPPGDAYRFNHNAATWSHDAESWRGVAWVNPDDPTKHGDTLFFPEFTEDIVYFGAQVPLSYEMIEERIKEWTQHPDVRLHVLGESLGGRNIYRLEISDANSPHPPEERWVHWIGNQHPGEHNAQRRMFGMIDWLLSDEGEDCRQRSICHIVPMTSPDGPANGWYRVNGQGVDMNRSYFSGGSDPEEQAHEACIVQQDLEKLMATDSPVTSLWSMHTWADQVEPILICGPEVGTAVGPWEEFRDLLIENDPRELVEPLKTRPSPEGPSNTWNEGPHVQFGISNILCEGSGNWTSGDDCHEAGEILMRSIAEYYRGTKGGL